MRHVEIMGFNILGDLTLRRGRLIGEKTHGYNLPSGARSLYPVGEGAIEAVF